MIYRFSSLNPLSYFVLVCLSVKLVIELLNQLTLTVSAITDAACAFDHTVAELFTVSNVDTHSNSRAPSTKQGDSDGMQKVFYIIWITNQWKAKFALLDYNKQRTRLSCLFYYCVCRNKCANTSDWLCTKQQNLTSDLLLFSWHCILFFLELWVMKTALHSTLNFKIAKKCFWALLMLHNLHNQLVLFVSTSAFQCLHKQLKHKPYSVPSS